MKDQVILKTKRFNLEFLNYFNAVMAKTESKIILFLVLFSFNTSFSQVGTLVGTGYNCQQYPILICPGTAITPNNYQTGSFYPCTMSPNNLDVSFSPQTASWRVSKHNWTFQANVGGQINGLDASGTPQIISFNTNDIVTPLSYSGSSPILLQFAINGIATGVPLNQSNFAITINAVTFGSNSYTYCPNITPSLSITPVVPQEGGPWTFNWSPSGAGAPPITVNPTVNTIYTVIATTTGTPCVSTTTIAVTVSCTPSGCCIGNPCPSIITNPLLSNWQVPINNFNYIFSKNNEGEKGKVGIGVIGCNPGNLLEVNKGTTSNISGLRLTDLKTATPSASNSKALSIDVNGDVILVSAAAGGITNACATANFVPKTSTGGNLICSQIFDDATSVGIGATGPFNYTSLSVTGVTSVPSTGTVRLFVNGVTKASAYFATSDQRFKKQITKIENANDIIKKLEGKSYYWNTEEFKDRGFNSVKQFGFIAQELEKVIPEAVATDESGYKSVNYDMIIPVLVEGAKEQLLVIENQQKQIDELKNLVQSLLANMSAENTKSTNSQAVNLSDKNSIILNQNVPNPFAESTLISYSIPIDFVKAQLVFFTIDGKIIKSVDLTEKGQGSINVLASDLSSGIYSYSLIVDEKIIETKKMIKD